jgi:dCMP deaminase
MQKITKDQIDFMRRACLLCDRSHCGYKTGCVAVLGGKVLFDGWNETLPGEVYCQHGKCIRELEALSGGRDIDKVCSIHAEASVVAQAASQGVSLKGVDIYVTTFPCLICSRLLAKTGIGRLFYMSSYMGGDQGSSFFQAADIPVIKVKEEDVWKVGSQ